MKYLKLSRIAKCILASTFLASGIVLSTLPIMLKSNTTNNKEKQKIQTNKIEHDSNVKVYNSVDDITVNWLSVSNEACMAYVTTSDDPNTRKLYVWGANQAGQLGNGTYDDVATPMEFDTTIFGEYTAIEIVIGNGVTNGRSSHAIVTVGSTQKLYRWGQNTRGQLGVKHSRDLAIPQLIDSTNLWKTDAIKSIYTNTHMSTYIITKSNDTETLWCAGANDNGQLGNGFKIDSNTFWKIPLTLKKYISIKRLECTTESIAAIIEMEDKTWQLYVWGYNWRGALALSHSSEVLAPTQNTNPIFNSLNLRSSHFTFKNSGWIMHASTGVIHVWGNNEYGSLGVGHTVNLTAPVLFPSENLFKTSSSTLKEMSIGDSSYAIMIEDGQHELYVWGRNVYGQLGDGTTTDRAKPQKFNKSKIGNPATFTRFNFYSNPQRDGFTASIIVHNFGKLIVYVWGNNEYGQLGSKLPQRLTTPTEIIIPNNAELVNHNVICNSSLTVRDQGKLRYYGMGSNAKGALGTGDFSRSQDWVEMMRFNSTTIKPSQKISDSSAADVFKTFINAKSHININELQKYAKITDFPTDAILTVTSSKIDSANGSIDLGITADKYYQALTAYPIHKNKLFNVKLIGFKRVSDIPIIKKNEANQPPAQFYAKAVTNDLVNRQYLEQYLDLSCIPATAVLTIDRIKPRSDKILEFKLTSTQTYKNNGQTNNETYSQIISFNVPAQNTDSIVLIVAIVGAGIAAAIIFTIVYLIIRNRKYINMIDDTDLTTN